MSLTLVMVTASGVLAALLVRAHEAHVEPLRRLAGRALAQQASSPRSQPSALPGLRWWDVGPGGSAHALDEETPPIDPASLALAREARARGVALLQIGRPWQPTRLATPAGSAVTVAWLPPVVSGLSMLGTALSAVGVFTALGVYLMRRRVVGPLQDLAGAARAIGEGDLETRLPVEGVRETAEVALAFNEMSGELAIRTQALEKAVTELRATNRSLRTARDGLDRAERLATVGRLASGVAHEVGNPMGALLAFLDLVGRDPGLSEQGRAHLAKAAQQGERVRVILRELLDFSRPPRHEPVAVDLAEVARETADLVRAQSRYRGVRISVEVEADPPPARADRSAVSQILLNLLLNAADASGAEGGRIRIRVRPSVQTRRADEAGRDGWRRRHPDAVECRVEDEGPGIAPEDRERIFDPFFTTKAPGEGTGLGLSNAVRLAEQLAGRLALCAEPAPGAAFALTLPAWEVAPPGSALRDGDAELGLVESS